MNPLANLTPAVDPVTTVTRALSVLDAFEPGETLGVTEIARRTGLPKSTTHRVLSALESRDIIAREGRQYRLGLLLFEMGTRVPLISKRCLGDVAMPVAADLYAETGQTVHVGILDGNEVVYAIKVHGAETPHVPTRVGSRMPAYCTAIGKALLANSSQETMLQLLEHPLRPYTVKTLVRPKMLISNLSQVKEDGVAFDLEETKTGLSCIAMPILDTDRNTIAALSLAGRPKSIESHVGTLRRAARALEDRIAERTSG